MHFRPLILFANYFYGSFHFIVTIFAGVLLYRSFSDDYPRFRNTLAIATLLALIGFTFYPLAPPRMFPQLGFVDTLLKDPAFWSFNSGGAAKVSNQFAAMPSVHIAWSTWCACALGPRLQRRAARALAWAYPLITLTVIIITANHYILDAVAGLAVLAVAWIAGEHVHTGGTGRRPPGGPGARRRRGRHLVCPARDGSLRPRPHRARRVRHRTRAAIAHGRARRDHPLRGPDDRLSADAGVARVRRRRRHAGRAPRTVGGRQERLPCPIRRPPRRRPAPPHVQGPRPRRGARTRTRRGLPPGEHQRRRPAVEGSVPHAARSARHGRAARGVTRSSGDPQGAARPRREARSQRQPALVVGARARVGARHAPAGRAPHPVAARRLELLRGRASRRRRSRDGDVGRSRVAPRRRASGWRRTPTRSRASTGSR